VECYRVLEEVYIDKKVSHICLDNVGSTVELFRHCSSDI
jgi:hypothetical protein